MSNPLPPSRMPCAYICHGGGPMPLLGQQPEIKEGLEGIAKSMPKPSAIIVVSAHYESSPVSIMTAERPGMYYDYGGFPPETYRYRYDAPGDPILAERIGASLNEVGVPSAGDPNRGYDHGMFVPLMIMYPDADVPVVGISVPSDSDVLWKLGQALEPFRNEGMLVLGSGVSFHNFSAFVGRTSNAIKRASIWNDWLQETACLTDIEERKKRLTEWQSAPEGTFAHPTPEHFTPLLVVAAAAGSDVGKSVYPLIMANLPMSQFLYS